MEINLRTIEDITILKVKSQEYNIEILDIGAAIYKLETKNSDGFMENIVLTYKDINDYKKFGLYLGANIGRFSGRIKNGEFNLNKKTYYLEKNENNINFLHGGSKPLHNKKMIYKITKSEEKICISFFGKILEKDDGIPGNIDIEIKYILDKENIRIEYHSTSSEDTIINITNHSYFNLSGDNKYDIKNHILEGNIYEIWKSDKNNIPASNHKINFFDKINILSDFINEYHPQILTNKGIDNPFSFEGFITLKDVKSKRKITMSSSYNSVVLYTQHIANKQNIINHLKNSVFQGLAIEFQNLPNDIENSILKKGDNFFEYINIKIN